MLKSREDNFTSTKRQQKGRRGQNMRTDILVQREYKHRRFTESDLPRQVKYLS